MVAPYTKNRRLYHWLIVGFALVTLVFWTFGPPNYWLYFLVGTALVAMSVAGGFRSHGASHGGGRGVAG